MFHIWRFTLRFMWNELHKIDTLKNVSMLALSQKYVLKNYVPDLTARLYDQLWYPNLIWINVWNIYLLCVNVVYLNKCAHTIKSLNLTDSVQNVWQKILIAPSPSSSQKFTLRDAWILDIILIFIMFEFQLFLPYELKGVRSINEKFVTSWAGCCMS